jgi:hypothetical protein
MQESKKMSKIVKESQMGNLLSVTHQDNNEDEPLSNIFNYHELNYKND